MHSAAAPPISLIHKQPGHIYRQIGHVPSNGDVVGTQHKPVVDTVLGKDKSVVIVVMMFENPYMRISALGADAVGFAKMPKIVEMKRFLGH